MIGIAFGTVKALALLPARHAVDPETLGALHRRLTRIEPGVNSAILAVELLTVIGVIGLVA